MIRRPPRSKRTDTLFPYTPPVRAELVSALRVVTLGQLDGIARIAQIDEVRSLYDAAAVNIQTRNDPFEMHLFLAGVVTVAERPFAMHRVERGLAIGDGDRKSTRLNSSH